MLVLNVCVWNLLFSTAFAAPNSESSFGNIWRWILLFNAYLYTNCTIYFTYICIKIKHRKYFANYYQKQLN